MTASNTINSLSHTVPNMAERAHQAIDRAADKATPALDRVRTGAHNTIDKVADSAATGVDWATENSKVIARKGSDLTEVACGYVRERPIATVAGAVALGYLIGRLLK